MSDSYCSFPFRIQKILQVSKKVFSYTDAFTLERQGGSKHRRANRSFLFFNGVGGIWSAICFKIMTRYTCGFFPRILAIIPATRYTCVFLPRILAFFPALWGFYSQVYDHFLTNVHIYMRTKKAHIYAFYKQAYVRSSYKRHRIISSAKDSFLYDGAEK